MSSVRLATFNVENLFARYRFRQNFNPLESDGFTINNLAFEIFEESEKRITSKAIAEVDADIIALQEVENLLVMDRFHSVFLRGKAYPYRLLIDGNDPRNIDIAIMSKFPIVSARSFRHERDGQGRADLFSRDCLEAVIDIHGRPLTLFVNHFKSMMGGRKATRDRRVAQSERVKAIVEERFGGNLDGDFAIVGDLNDYPQVGDDTTCGIDSLIKHPRLVNILDRLPAAERWTHWYKSGRRGERARQLDYILLSASLDERAGNPKPDIYRKGLPWRAEEYTGPRLDEVGENEPKASDHCILSVEIPIQALKPAAASTAARQQPVSPAGSRKKTAAKASRSGSRNR